MDVDTTKAKTPEEQLEEMKVELEAARATIRRYEELERERQEGHHETSSEGREKRQRLEDRVLLASKSRLSDLPRLSKGWCSFRLRSWRRVCYRTRCYRS